MPDAKARSIDTVERTNHNCVSGGSGRHQSPDPPNLQTLDNWKVKNVTKLRLATTKDPTA